ncbi:MAG: fatty acid desaturase [Hyphomicrobiaceae bacterium]
MATDVRPETSGRLTGKTIAALKEARDNITNVYYLGRVYLIMAATLVAAIWLIEQQRAGAFSFWWNIPIVILAITIIGASQHQLGGATHEATHFILFRNRRANELVSDWLCMFPLYSTTYQFRLHHLAHHQFINDPERDPDFYQLHDSGHDLDFPLEHVQFFKALLSQLWLPNLVRYTLTRARYNGLGVDTNPYRDKTRKTSRGPNVVIGGYSIVLPLVLSVLSIFLFDYLTLALLFVGFGAAAIAYLLSVPEEQYPATHIKPIIAHKTTALSRIVFFMVLYTGLSLVEYFGVLPAWPYYLLLWVLPLFTTFPFFMIMRQWVQHGNADRGRLTNTRVFLVNPFVRYAVFPFGMDYHLPHHIYAAVPHFRLPELHDLLRRSDPDYAREGVVVEGYFRSPHPDAGNPTVVEVLGPVYARRGDEVFIASDAIEDAEVDDARHIREEEAESRRQTSG